MIDLKFFIKGDRICGDDFSKIESIEKINPNYILSISPLLSFTLPLSGRFVGKYVVVTMSNDDKYFIKEESYNNLINTINTEKN